MKDWVQATRMSKRIGFVCCQWLVTDTRTMQIKRLMSSPGLKAPTRKKDKKPVLFYFNSDSSMNPFLKTVTLKVTSTCTSLSIISCIPAANLPDAPVPICRRRRDIEMNHPDEDRMQFSVNPSNVQPVVPTAVPWPAVPRDSAQISSVDVTSSKEVEINNSKLSGISTQFEEPDREARFLWKHQFTSTTTTSWSVVSSTLTQTFVPAADFDCLPPWLCCLLMRSI
ncbi:uncharacterized protein LOC116921593 [Daphnia magna]|uniref:uncharacterized protein LOC116921593 n=1 Tax=Daphnia magna TaxID=35525 RepID=UPI001E1BB370|nr:uncharacterized protein LOC116921593 [Daphnia magna]